MLRISHFDCDYSPGQKLLHQSELLLMYEENQTLARTSRLAPRNSPFPTDWQDFRIKDILIRNDHTVLPSKDNMAFHTSDYDSECSCKDRMKNVHYQQP